MHEFHTVTLKLCPLGMGCMVVVGDVIEYTLVCLLSLLVIHAKGKDWSSSSWEDDVDGRGMTTDANP